MSKLTRRETPAAEAAPPFRNEQTLRRMWSESINLATKAQQMTAEADAAGKDAATAEQVAAAHRQAERTARGIADAMLSEALDLVDMVNEKRAAAGLEPLTAGEPYDPPAEQLPGPVHVSDADLPPVDVSGDPFGIPANRIGEPAPLPGPAPADAAAADGEVAQP